VSRFAIAFAYLSIRAASIAACVRKVGLSLSLCGSDKTDPGNEAASTCTCTSWSLSAAGRFVSYKNIREIKIIINTVLVHHRTRSQVIYLHILVWRVYGVRRRLITMKTAACLLKKNVFPTIVFLNKSRSTVMSFEEKQLVHNTQNRTPQHKQTSEQEQTHTTHHTTTPDHPGEENKSSRRHLHRRHSSPTMCHDETAARCNPGRPS
jgi:hypothetical protein